MTSRGYVFEFTIVPPGVGLRSLHLEANILINHEGRACIADFSLLTVIPDKAYFISAISFSEGGSTRWMSPELLDPERSGFEDGRPTKESDCYALGMVVYEVLTGQVPFVQDKNTVVIQKVMDGERPARPRGRERAWLTDDLWGMLELCWRPKPFDRPSLKTLLQCLEGVTLPVRLHSPAPTVIEGVVSDVGDPSGRTVKTGTFSISFKASNAKRLKTRGRNLDKRPSPPNPSPPAFRTIPSTSTSNVGRSPGTFSESISCIPILSPGVQITTSYTLLVHHIAGNFRSLALPP